jgi:hypothetical protein
MRVARVYLRVSTQGQDLDRQESIIAEAREAGYYIAGVYREKASGARADRPELLRLIAGLQPGEVVVAEKIDRISRLPLPEAEKLIETIRNKGARLAVPGVVDLSDIAASTDGVAKIVLESIQQMLLKLALQMARDDFEDCRCRAGRCRHIRQFELGATTPRSATLQVFCLTLAAAGVVFQGDGEMVEGGPGVGLRK